MLGRDDVDHAPKAKGGAVPDIVYPEDGPPSLWECLRPGSSAQLRPLHGAGLPAKRLSDGAQAVPWGPEKVAVEAANGTNERSRRICSPTEGRPKSEGKRGKTKRVDLDGYVETCRQESLRALESGERTGNKKKAGARHQGKPGGR